MKAGGLILSVIMFYSFSSPVTESKKKLDHAMAEQLVTTKQYRIFSKQLYFRIEIGLQGRIDSMKSAGFDIAYVEEYYFHKKGKFLVKEYYFSSAGERQERDTDSDQLTGIYKPDNYFENCVLSDRYFFHNEKGKEQLTSIRLHMRNRRDVDTIAPLVKKEVLHAGCGMTGRIMKEESEKAERKYKKKLTPDYYLIESLMESDQLTLSFQVPAKCVQ